MIDVMDFAADFTAIDFETASQRPDSACQLGAVVVRDGQMVDQLMWMIRPEPLHFSRGNIGIHGITPERVRDEPTFGELWPDIADKLGNDCLVAHNASFDIKVLLACLCAHRKSTPELNFTCTRAIARRTWPHHRRYGLKPLSNWLGIRFQHHDALEDSVACAKILLAAGIDREAKSLRHLEQRLKLSRGKAGSWGYRGPSGKSPRRAASDGPKSKQESQTQGLPFLFPNQVADRQNTYLAVTEPAEQIDLQRLLVRAEFIRPLRGKKIVLAGHLKCMSRDDAENLATRLGGTCQKMVDEGTDYLVIRSASKTSATADQCDDERRAQSFKKIGNPIKIVDESEFLGLVITPNSDS